MPELGAGMEEGGVCELVDGIVRQGWEDSDCRLREGIARQAELGSSCIPL